MTCSFGGGGAKEEVEVVGASAEAEAEEEEKRLLLLLLISLPVPAPPRRGERRGSARRGPVFFCVWWLGGGSRERGEFERFFPSLPPSQSFPFVEFPSLSL